MSDMRIERDSFGDIEVPAQHWWGAQTARSLHFFAISTERMPPELIRALVQVKLCAARVNAALGRLDTAKAEAIAAAAQEVLDGRWADEFPLSVWQTGSGTQSNMNVNEVLANRASAILGGPVGQGRLVHPNDDVNRGQSSNDVFPTAMHVAAAAGIADRVLPALRSLAATLDAKAKAFQNIVKIGRTHLQDATPITLGQEFSGYVAQLRAAEEQIQRSLEPLCELAIGGTAVGTGLNTHPEFGERTAAMLAARLGLPFRAAANKFAALASHDPMVAAHGALKTLAVALMKLANDIRWMSSGPRAGLGELSIPENEPGSSIMPGKVNPTQCEAVTMLSCQVMANDVALSLGGSMGNFELNVFKPLIAYAFLQSVRVLADGMQSFNRHCIAGLDANTGRIGELVSRSLMLVTALAPHIGYDKAAAIAKKAHAEHLSLREAALALGYVSAGDFDRWVVPEDMLHPS